MRKGRFLLLVNAPAEGPAKVHTAGAFTAKLRHILGDEVRRVFPVDPCSRHQPRCFRCVACSTPRARLLVTTVPSCLRSTHKTSPSMTAGRRRATVVSMP
jgi:hypothetical protein